LLDGRPRRLARLRQTREILGIQSLKDRPELFSEAMGTRHRPVRVGCRCEAIEDRDALRLEPAEHLAKRGVIASDAVDILVRDVAEIQGVDGDRRLKGHRPSSFQLARRLSATV
jgi:hypothetical protein